MTTFAQRERAALCNTLRAVGPDAPTLCEGWTARDLAAHLVLREHAPLGSLGIWAKPLAGYAQKVQDELAAQSWEQLVGQVAARPPLWHPARFGGKRVEQVFDDGEMFVHHEDLRRGDGVARPRDLSAEDEAALWRVLVGSGRLAFRKSEVTIVVDVPGHQARRLHEGGNGQVTLRGAVGEVLLAAYGRGRAAELEVEGAHADVATLRATALGL